MVFFSLTENLKTSGNNFLNLRKKFITNICFNEKKRKEENKRKKGKLPEHFFIVKQTRKEKSHLEK